MATLTGQSIASSYEQLLSLPDGGGATTTLKAVTDGDAGTTFAMQLSTTTICIDNPTADSATQGGILRLQSDDGALMQSGSRLGVIEFGGAEDSSNNITVGARIEAITDAAWSATENGADMVFYTTDGNASQTEVMRLTGTDSYVGIGTAAPSVMLDLESSTSSKIVLENTGNAGTEITGDADRSGADGTVFYLNGLWNGTKIGDIRFVSGDDTTNKDDGYIKFSTAEGGTLAERMRIEQDGNVGIGTSAPSTMLDITASASGQADIQLDCLANTAGINQIRSDTDRASDGGDMLRIQVYNNSGTEAGSINFQRGSGDTKSDIHFRTSNSESMRIDEDGNVGIGTATPDGLFEISDAVTGFDPDGQAMITNTSEADGNYIGTIYRQRSGVGSNVGKAWFGAVRSGDFGLQDFVWLSDNVQDDNLIATTDEVMRITSAGNVTMSNQPAFSAHPASVQSDIATGTDVTVVFGTEVFDIGGNFASNAFTAPVTGKYQLNVFLRLDAVDTAANYYEMKIITSNRTYSAALFDPDGLDSDPAYWNLSSSVLADMDASDTAHIVIFQAAGTAQTDIDSGGHFTGFLAC